jgi:hypothetical protein
MEDTPQCLLLLNEIETIDNKKISNAISFSRFCFDKKLPNWLFINIMKKAPETKTAAIERLGARVVFAPFGDWMQIFRWPLYSLPENRLRSIIRLAS